jgi:hypothetical protein
MVEYELAIKDVELYTDKDTQKIRLELLPQEYALIKALNDLTNEIRRLVKNG